MRVFLWLAAAVAVCAQQMPTCSTVLWSPCDLAFPLESGEDATRAELRAEFRSPHKDTRTLRAFRDGNALVLRFTPDEVGEWDYRITSSLKRLDGQLGKTAGTPSQAAGFVRTVNVHHFQTANLQPHLWMGSEIANFVTIPRADFDAQLAARAAEKFTHIRVTLEPSTDLKEATSRVQAIHDRGIVIDIAFGSLPDDRRERERFITDAAARFSAFNITWAGVPAYEHLRNARTILKELGTLLQQLDGYKHIRSTLAESSSATLLPDNWMNIVSYGTPDPNIGAVEHQLVALPAVNSGIKTRADLWNATMNGQYPSSGAGRDFAVWFDLLSKTRHWELEPYFEVSGGRAVAVRDVELRGGDIQDAVEYLVYVAKPGPVELSVEDHGYDVAWINPATGDRVAAKNYKGKSFAGEPPDKEHDWVLHVSREGHKQGMLKTYKFESRPIRMQTPETDSKTVPFEIETPSGEISMRTPALFSLKINRATRATSELNVVWTAELTTGTADGGRVVGTGREGTLRLPSFYSERLPAILSLRAAILNANGKVYIIDRAFRIVP